MSIEFRKYEQRVRIFRNCALLMYDIHLMQELITSAGQLALTYFRKVTPTWKDNQTYVTDADIAVQEYLKKELEARFPDDGMIAEEQDLSRPPRSGNRYWVIDPIDGTASFARGFPLWGIAIGLVTPAEAIGGFFYLPPTNDFYYTMPDGTVRHNGQIVRIPRPDPFSREAVLLTGARFYRKYAVSQDYPGKIRSLGSTVAHLCYVAAGSADAAFIQRVSLWDLAAGLAMVHQNHGVLEYLDGSLFSLKELLVNHKAPQSMLAGHPDAVKQYRQWLVNKEAR
ncbi:inositol-phosphate phosphatase [Candidatus Vecturithrix granuli]|uniref:Inositol-phosphate phosphatase n=1 Tax=Vecturithrix granuli TaxID=1499967 RepID=A0A081C7U4_VECG1|nr:inositol-phosphate phosphatase [Candidatus Vecturithrix granuli]